MDDLYQPLSAKKPTLLDLWLSYHFDISTLASSANVEMGTIDAMMKSLPVLEDDAKKVLAQLSVCYHKDYTLETVHVVLKRPVANRSEVARLLQEIDAEYQAATQGMRGLALGRSQHAFITRRMENMARRFVEFGEQLGDDAVMQAMIEWDSQEGIPINASCQEELFSSQITK